MKYSIDKDGGIAIMELQEDNLNSLIAPSLKSELIILKNEGFKIIILNLSQVKYIDSSGLSAVLTGVRMWGEGGLFLLAAIESPMVKKLIEISKLDTVLNIKEDLEQAKEYAKSYEEDLDMLEESDN